MNVRLNAIASLAGEMGGLTVALGGVLVKAATTRDRCQYYEDHF
jgi:hypothetical protein